MRTQHEPQALPPQDTLQAAADALRQARATGRPVARISESHGIAGVDAAYAVAALNTRARLAATKRWPTLPVAPSTPTFSFLCGWLISVLAERAAA